MSQQKVDKYKKEKANREKQIKKKRIKKIVSVFAVAIVFAFVIGIFLGRTVYNVTVERRKATATVKAEAIDLWMQEQWSANYSELWGDAASDTDAVMDQVINLDDVNDASASDAN